MNLTFDLCFQDLLAFSFVKLFLFNYRYYLPAKQNSFNVNVKAMDVL